MLLTVNVLFCRALYCFVQMNMLLWWWEKCDMTVPKVFSHLVQKHPEKVAFHFNTQQWTFAKVRQCVVHCGCLNGISTLSSEIGSLHQQKFS